MDEVERKRRQRLCQRRYAERNREYYREMARKHRQENPGECKKARKFHKHSPKGLVRKRLGNAVRRGLISKPTACERCRQEQKPERLHGHHDDYAAKP